MIVVRDQNGEVRAFLNACRHRGARLEDVPCGHKERFTCPYHAWTYDLSGQLKSVFREETFGHIDKANHGLIRLPVQEKYGLVYVNPDPEGRVDIDDILGDLGPQLGAAGIWPTRNSSAAKSCACERTGSSRSTRSARATTSVHCTRIRSA